MKQCIIPLQDTHRHAARRRLAGQLLSLSLLGALLVAPGAQATNTTPEALPLHLLKLPAGFAIEVYAHAENARQMAEGDNGITYVGSRSAGKVHAVIDTNGDGRADQVKLIAEGLKQPSGLAYRDGNLYVGAVYQILVYRDIEAQLSSSSQALPRAEVIINSLPDKHHGWKYLKFGPDGKLYFAVGAPCNICLSEDPVFATILRIDVDAANPVPETVAHGVRNTLGFDWHPTTHELWFTDNGRDRLGDDSPPCELNRLQTLGQHFGYPFVHGQDILDPEFGIGKDPADFTAPALDLGPHVAPLGMVFYTGKLLPARYQQQILIAEHGSWNRSYEAGHTGYRITLARSDADGRMHYEVLIDGWLQNNVGWGRPVDILQRRDGSLLISDDRADVIYRVSYTPADT